MRGMTIPGIPQIGIDLVEPTRLQARLEADDELRAELFREGELRYCEAQAAPYEHLAARFCAKEAVMKALGLDVWDPLDIEIVGGGERIRVQLHGDIARRAEALGVEVTVSMTHLASLAGAVALVQAVGTGA
jgi:holo-[acyl-carrier protein] synthase